MRTGHCVLNMAFAGKLGHISLTKATNTPAKFYLSKTMAVTPEGKSSTPEIDLSGKELKSFLDLSSSPALDPGAAQTMSFD